MKFNKIKLLKTLINFTLIISSLLTISEANDTSELHSGYENASLASKVCRSFAQAINSKSDALIYIDLLQTKQKNIDSVNKRIQERIHNSNAGISILLESLLDQKRTAEKLKRNKKNLIKNYYL